MPKKSTLLTTKQVSEKVGISENHLRQLIRNGDIKAERIAGSTNWFIDSSEVKNIHRVRRPKGYNKKRAKVKSKKKK